VDHPTVHFIGRMLPYYKFVRILAFPSISILLFQLIATTILGCLLAFFLVNPVLSSALHGIVFGVFVFFVPSVLVDIIASRILLKNDPPFSFRRFLALSFFSCTTWILIIIIGGIAHNQLGIFHFPQDLFLIGLFTIIPLRSIVVFSLSSKSNLHKITFSLLQPLISTLTTSFLMVSEITVILGAFILATTLSIIPLIFLLRFIERQGKSMIKVSPMRIFKAFLVDWLDRKNEMFEAFLKEIGTESEIEVTLIRFDSKRSSETKGIIVISNFHPGPFLNVGSSMLPYLIQNRFETKNIAVFVPHGISGHENNLVSQEDNTKVISAIKTMLRDCEPSNMVSTFKTIEVGSAKVNAQIFGKCLLLTLTQSPKDMEDIPIELGKEVASMAKTKFKHVGIIDSHNCINDVRMFIEEELNDLRSAAYEAIESSSAIEKKVEMGVAKYNFENIEPRQGVGPGGVRVFLFKNFDQLIAYIIIDANNMIKGLREKILTSLIDIGIDGGEIMTTDTHVVNGLVRAKLGYYPFGEILNQDNIVNSIKKTVKKAQENLEEVTICSSSKNVSVTSLGSRSLENLTSFMYNIARLVVRYIGILLLVSNLIGLALFI
jgi:predicted neutral ceramidase superfamily lipid hydrolase